MVTTSIKRILIAVDESGSSEFATATAAQLATELGAAVSLLHVVRPPMPYGAEVMILTPEAMEDAMRRGRVLLCERREDLPASLDVTEMLEDGIPEERIVARAADWHADLVVVGDHNRGRLSSFLLGSTAEQIVRRSPCPVLVARPKVVTATQTSGHRRHPEMAELPSD